MIGLLVIMLCIASCFTVSAKTKEEKTGSIKLILTDGVRGTSKENVKFSYAKVADWINGTYQLTQNYKSSGVDLNMVDCSQDLDEAAKQLTQYGVSEDYVATDKNGIAVIEDLTMGVYILEVSDSANYENISPILVSIPAWCEETKQMNYDVEVFPKHTPSPGRIITKTPDYDGSGIFTGDSASVVLYAIVFASSIAALCMIVWRLRSTKWRKKNEKR